MMNYKRWIGCILLIPLILVFIDVGTVIAQSSANYKMKKNVVSEAGIPSTSSLFKLDDCVGQPSPAGASASANYTLSAGFLAAPVVLSVNPILSVNPTTLNFGASQTSLSFQISNSGSGTLTWTAVESPDESWIISVNPVSGAGNGTVEVKVDRSGLSAGNYTAIIKVSSNGGDANVTVNLTVAGNLPLVKFNPKSSNMRVNNPASVDIVIENITDLGSFEFEISFDGTIVQVAQSSDVVQGPFLGSTGRSVIPVGPTINNSTGSVVYAAASLGSQAGANGNGVLATITWTPLKDGKTTLDLKNVKVSDTKGIQFQVIEEDGEINVTSRFWADIDGDNDIDIFDVQLVAAHWNTKVGDPNYDPIYDVDNNGTGDGDVDIFDVQLVASWWNKPIPPGLGLLSNMAENQSDNLGKTIRETQNISLRIIPQEPLNNGMVTTIALMAEKTTDLGAFQFDLILNSEKVQISEIELGEFLKSSGNNVSILGPKRDHSGTRITFGAFSFGENSAAEGAGILVRIKLKGRLDKATAVDFENFLMVDSKGNELNIISINNEYTNFLKQQKLPQKYALSQNYPNPFNPETHISFDLPDGQKNQNRVMLFIYNINGQLIRKLVDENKSAGTYSILWDGKNDKGETAVSGLYVYSLTVGDFRTSRKMLFLK